MPRPAELSCAAGTLAGMDPELGADPHLQGAPEPDGLREIRTIEDVQTRVDHLLESGPRTLVIDISEVAHLSSAISALMWVRRCCSTRGVDLVLSMPSRRLAGTLQHNEVFAAMGVEPPATRTGRARHGLTAPWRAR